jgi:chemotaxis protein CheX
MVVDLKDYIIPFVEVTRDTFKDFVQIENVESKTPFYLDPDKGFEWDISAVIGLSGVVKGAVIVSMKQELAVKLTDILAGPGHSEMDADVVDAIGEINNIIAGNIKPKVPNGDKIVISIPTVIKGKEHSIAWPSKQTRILCIPFKAYESDIFHLMVAIDLENK